MEAAKRFKFKYTLTQKGTKKGIPVWSITFTPVDGKPSTITFTGTEKEAKARAQQGPEVSISTETIEHSF